MYDICLNTLPFLLNQITTLLFIILAFALASVGNFRIMNALSCSTLLYSAIGTRVYAHIYHRGKYAVQREKERKRSKETSYSVFSLSR